MMPAATQGVAQQAGTVTGWNLLSRVTGFVRVLVIGGALGATRLGDTYQSANQVSNLLFEFLAAGTLSAVLIPGLTARMIDADDHARAEAFAGALLARALVVLGAVGLIGIVAARPIMDVLLAGNDSPSRSAQVRLGAFLLLFVMPQLALYAWGAVVTATLNANGHFSSGAAAPVANNVFVIAAVGAFWARGASGLDLGWIDRALLGSAALGGVICMTLVPALMLRRFGLSLRPRWAVSEPIAMSIREVGWATVVVLPAQAFLFTALVVSGRVRGGMIACQVAMTFFLLPHALLGHPLTTVLFPRMARAWVAGDTNSFRRESGLGLRTVLLLTAPAGAALLALAPWILRAVSVGALASDAGEAVVASALMGYALGLSAYSWSLLTSRISYAAGDVRTPAFAALAGGALGVAMLGVATFSDGNALVYRVGLAHSVMATVMAAGTLAVLVRRRIVTIEWLVWGRIVVAAVVAGLGARLVADQIGAPTSRGGALVTVVVGLVVAGGVYAVGVLLAGIRPRDLRAELT
jgi:putative peptidoglycan lipid II flippase